MVKQTKEAAAELENTEVAVEEKPKTTTVLLPKKDANGIVTGFEPVEFTEDELQEYRNRTANSVLPPLRLGAQIDDSRSVKD